MKAISLFSGAGGFEIGFQRAGIETVLQCEIDPWALAVLRRHWPDVERIEDVRTLRRDSGSQVGKQPVGESGEGLDLIYGGFPCQDLSVAGKRAGLGGERSGLWLEFRRIVSELRPRWVVVENVPGLFHSNERRDFATLVEGFTSIGYGVAWRAVDAQFFLVPQRRRRVFFVATIDDRSGQGAHRAAQVLSLCEGCGRNTQKGGQAREGVAASLRSRSASRGVNPPGRGGEDDSNLVFGIGGGDIGYAVRAHASRSGDKGDGGMNTTLVAQTVRPGGEHWKGADHQDYVAETLRGRPGAGSNSLGALATAGDEIYNLAPIDDIGVRRFMPIECERLQGWPDDWTRWRDDGREIPDTHRYRLIGNGVAATVAEWIGRRLVDVNVRFLPEKTRESVPGGEP